jgi:hypothetical protein
LFSTVLSLVFVPAMFMLMDDIGTISWHFGRKLLASHAETEPPPADRKGPPTVVRSPAAE